MATARTLGLAVALSSVAWLCWAQPPLEALPAHQRQILAGGMVGKCIGVVLTCTGTVPGTCTLAAGNICQQCPAANPSWIVCVRIGDLSYSCESTYDNTNPIYCNTVYTNLVNPATGLCPAQCAVKTNTVCGQRIPNTVSGDDCPK
jgi:hypothetical protein